MHHQRSEELRVTWVASVLNLDWPSKASLSIQDDIERIQAQKSDLIQILEEIKELNMNTVIFQVKPCADALYRSDILPWSSYLTGTLGKSPGFDPLEFAIEQAHARGIKLHAWLNPYRVSMDTRSSTADELNQSSTDSEASVFKQHPEWIKTSYNRFVLDPGLPEVQEWIGGVVEEIVKRYDVDGLQFDDYFYYESNDFPLDDEDTYKKYGGCFDNMADWRRNNTYVMISRVSSTIRNMKPNVEFGISPSGVWRNKQSDPLGSDTQAGAPHYDYAYADTKKWLTDNIIDYIVPQIYWPISREIVRYDVIARWWSEVVKHTNAKLYIGMALYKVGTHSAIEPDWSIDEGVLEFKSQLDLNESLEEVGGCVLFRHDFVKSTQTHAAIAYLKQRWA